LAVVSHREMGANSADEDWKGEILVAGYGLTGCCRAMFPNRISYTFDLKGPSFAVDTACSSSLYAMHQAIISMRSGQCDAAIVGGVNLLLKPTSSLQFHRLSMLSPGGACKAFDSSGDGYVRSEAAVVIYLQHTRDARRVYATVVNSRVNTDGHKDQGITYPNGYRQYRLMGEVCAEACVNPAEVVYVEAHGTGTKVGDPQEVNSIAELFCWGRRSSPLLMGSVKSNMGHSEPASGLCSIAKVLIAMEQGVIPGNLHFKQPNPDIPALSDGRIKVVDEATPWKGGLVAVNSFGFGGANAHVLLRSNSKPKATPLLNVGVPKMAVVSGRTEEAVIALLDEVPTFLLSSFLFTYLRANSPPTRLGIAGEAQREGRRVHFPGAEHSRPEYPGTPVPRLPDPGRGRGARGRAAHGRAPTRLVRLLGDGLAVAGDG
jgi:fatty acid synthase